jgi:hypothetical protein
MRGIENITLMGDRNPMFEGEIDAEILDTSIETPSSKGFVKVNDWTQYHNQAVVFAHFADGGQLKTTHYDGQKKKEQQNFVQKDGRINVGSEEWQIKKLLVVVLDKKVSKEE